MIGWGTNQRLGFIHRRGYAVAQHRRYEKTEKRATINPLILFCFGGLTPPNAL